MFHYQTTNYVKDNIVNLYNNLYYVCEKRGEILIIIIVIKTFEAIIARGAH